MNRLLIIALVGFGVGTVVRAADEPKAPYVPGLGEFMSSAQTHHAKLWFAGTVGNWELAAYELDEIKETFDGAARLYPTDKNIPAP